MTNKMDLKIGENIRKIRELKGYSQEYMAQKMDISQRTYSNIESQNDKIDTQRLQTIAEILEVNIFDILAFDDKVLFNNSNFTQSSVGMYYMNNTVHFGESKLNEVQEARIQELQNQVNHLREQVVFLQNLLKKEQS